MATNKKDFDAIVTAARKQGWRVEQRRKNHYLWYAPNGKDVVTSGGTESDWRALKNHVARLRRAGFQG